MPTLELEQIRWQQGYRHVAGVDEAGRGCLAGPVVAGAVILPQGLTLPGVDDSKKLKPDQREALFEQLQAEALAVGVGICSPEMIDSINILWAAMEAMRRAAADLSPAADFLLIDGNRCFPDPEWPFETVIKGDARSHTIAAASIVAKVTRDRLMHMLHEEFPAYGWASNVGYPTRDHYEALAAHGPTPYHRRSFRLEPRK
ncbi:MAG TPA: ribonuclease HII [Rhodothermales bacterium]|nr:ribonuclease HII [Rhodothermales bacterium]